MSILLDREPRQLTKFCNLTENNRHAFCSFDNLSLKLTSPVQAKAFFMIQTLMESSCV